MYNNYMNKFEFKNLVKDLKDSLKEKSFFKDLRKEVETGANGTQDYVVKKGVNKDTVATTKQQLIYFINNCNTSQTLQDEVHVQTCEFPQTLVRYKHQFDRQ